MRMDTLLAAVRAALVWLALAAPHSASAAQDAAEDEKPTIVVGTELDYPPYSFSDAAGAPMGLNVDLTRAIAHVMGLHVEIRIEPWGRIRKALEVGELDVVAGMFYSEEREKLVDFSPPYTTIHHAIFVRGDSPGIASEKELCGRGIIVMRGDIIPEDVFDQAVRTLEEYRAKQ